MVYIEHFNKVTYLFQESGPAKPPTKAYKCVDYNVYTMDYKP